MAGRTLGSREKLHCYRQTQKGRVVPEQRSKLLFTAGGQCGIRTLHKPTQISVFWAALSLLQVGRLAQELRTRNNVMWLRAKRRLLRWSPQTAGRIRCPRLPVPFPPSAAPE